MYFISAVFALVFSTTSFAQSPDLFGFASNQNNSYTIQNTDGKKVDLTIAQNEVNRILLTDESGVMRDIFGRITWFDDQANTIVKEQPGRDFKLSGSGKLLATYTKLGFAKVFNRSGEVVFSTNRPVSGLSVSENRIAWIDSDRNQLELRNLKTGRNVTLSFVKNAWLSENFLLTKNGDRFQLYGRELRQFPTETASDVQISDDLAVLSTADGRTKVYTPDTWKFTRANVKRAVLTQNYLALTDATGIDVYHRDGSFAARYASGVSVDYNNRVIAIRQTSGATVLIDPAGNGTPKYKLINRSDKLLMSARLALALNGSFYEVYSLDSANFGTRLFGGPRTIDAQAAGVVGLRAFGFVNPNAKSAQLWIPRPGATSSLESDAIKPILDQTMVPRVDVSVEAPSLNWTMF